MSDATRRLSVGVLDVRDDVTLKGTCNTLRLNNDGTMTFSEDGMSCTNLATGTQLEGPAADLEKVCCYYGGHGYEVCAVNFWNVVGWLAYFGGFAFVFAMHFSFI